MDILDEEVLALWRSLNQNNVTYIMVGGFATNLNGFKRFTADIDIWIKDTLENRKNLRLVLKELGIGDYEALETTQLIPGWTSIKLESGMELDIMTELTGFKEKDFDECYRAAPTATIYDVKIRFLNINHLITNKKSTGRSKDMIDVIELEKIKSQSSETN
jgi:hypothetical protein